MRIRCAPACITSTTAPRAIRARRSCQTNADGLQVSDYAVPVSIIDNGTQVQQIQSVYLQDEWNPLSPLTINYGLRYDHYSAYSSGGQLSPRLNIVWEFPTDTTLHGGYSRYFTPPPFELIGSETFTKFAGTSAVPPGSVTQDTAPIAERANYYDLGVQQKLLDKTLTLGVDSFYEQSQHLIDEGQFGAPIILTPFNYRYGLIGGVEFTANYSINNFAAYLNSAWQAAHGKEVESAQFNFSQDDLNYIASNYIHLDHEGRVSASSGVSYLWLGTRFSTDAIFGTGLRQSLTLPDGSVIPNGDHTPSYTQINLGATHDFEIAGSGPLTLRLRHHQRGRQGLSDSQRNGRRRVCAAVRTSTRVLRRAVVAVLTFAPGLAQLGGSIVITFRSATYRISRLAHF